MEKKKHIFSCFLIFLAGALDSYCYILHDGIFASMHTGNMIKIAVTLYYSEYGNIYKYVLPIILFMIGIFCAHFLTKTKHPQAIPLILAFVCYAIGFAIPIGKLNVLASCIMAFGVALQLQAVRTIYGFPVATTMSTGNLRSLFENLGCYVSTKDKHYLRGVLVYTTLIVFFLLGLVAMALFLRIII